MKDGHNNFSLLAIRLKILRENISVQFLTTEAMKYHIEENIPFLNRKNFLK